MWFMRVFTVVNCAEPFLSCLFINDSIQLHCAVTLGTDWGRSYGAQVEGAFDLYKELYFHMICPFVVSRSYGLTRRIPKNLGTAS